MKDDTHVSTARVHARNITANWIAQVANILLMLFLSPFIVHTLGKVQYGVWCLLTVFTGYMGLLDLGIRAGTGRFVMVYLAKGDHKRVNDTLRTSLGFFSAISVLVFAAAVGVGWLFPSFFASVPAKHHGTIQVLLILVAIQIWLTACRTAISSVLAAHERFDLARGGDLLNLAVRAVLTVWLLSAGYGLVGLMISVLAQAVLGTGVTYLLAKRVYPQLRVWPLALKRARLRELFGFGIAAFAATMAARLTVQTNQLIIGAAVSVAEVTTYAVGTMLTFHFSNFVLQIARSLFPAVQRAATQGKTGEVRWLLLRQVRLALLIGILGYVGFVVLGEGFIRLWMLGPKFPEASVVRATEVMRLMAASNAALLLMTGAPELLTAVGRIRSYAAISVFAAVLSVTMVLVFLLVFGWGVAGAALALLISRALVRVPVTTWYACHTVGINWASFMLRALGRAAVACGLFAASLALVQHLVPATSWGAFVLQGVLALVAYVPIGLLVLVPPADRKRIWQRLGWRVRAIDIDREGG